MTHFFYFYLSCWLLACLGAMILLLWQSNDTVLFQLRYRNFLLCRWKLALFFVATVSIAAISPYTDDPTWDCIDSIFMSVLTFITAPWAVGTIYRWIRGQDCLAQAYAAVCVWLFSASWSYDLYLLLKDGFYPPTWLSNIALSSLVYFCAGLLWNLEFKEGRGVIFAFMDTGWPSQPHDVRLGKILCFAVPLVFIVLAMMLPFLQ